jgi:dienelactone hydrolase
LHLPDIDAVRKVVDPVPDERVMAAVAWYGQIRPVITKGVRMAGPLDVAARIKAPILGLYGGEDWEIPVADVRAMEAALKAADKTAEFVIYPQVHHTLFLQIIAPVIGPMQPKMPEVAVSHGSSEISRK